jgi:hypothetical protein
MAMDGVGAAGSFIGISLLAEDLKFLKRIPTSCKAIPMTLI